METIAQLKRQVIAHIDHYFSGSAAAAELRAWALAHPTFANPKALDNSEDWMVSNALALMIALVDTGADRPTIEQELREARRFLTGEVPFPDDFWPMGLMGWRR